MKSIVFFPGTDALEDPRLRLAAYRVPGVYESIDRCQRLLDGRCPGQFDLHGLMTSANDSAPAWFRRLVLCSFAVQTTLYRDYVAREGHPDFAMGVSLGDVARSVAVGLADFEDAFWVLFEFARLGVELGRGTTAQIRLADTGPDALARLRLADYQLWVSVQQSDRHMLIAGATDNLERWWREAGPTAATWMRPMYPFPLHCPRMQPVARELVAPIANASRGRTVEIPIISTIYARAVDNAADAAVEIGANIVQTVRFVDAMRAVVARHSRVRFVNLGPSSIWLRFIARCPDIAERVECEDAFSRFILAREAA